jgi:hypothetical protein
MTRLATAQNIPGAKAIDEELKNRFTGHKTTEGEE